MAEYYFRARTGANWPEWSPNGSTWVDISFTSGVGNASVDETACNAYFAGKPVGTMAIGLWGNFELDNYHWYVAIKTSTTGTNYTLHLFGVPIWSLNYQLPSGFDQIAIKLVDGGEYLAIGNGTSFTELKMVGRWAGGTE